MKSHRQSFLWKAFCLSSPFSSLMNQWVLRSQSPIDLQHEMCLVVFRASQKIVSFSFCRNISPSFRPLPVNFTLIYRFQMILIVLARSVYTVISIDSTSKLSHNAFHQQIASSKTECSVISHMRSRKLHKNIINNGKTMKCCFRCYGNQITQQRREFQNRPQRHKRKNSAINSYSIVNLIPKDAKSEKNKNWNFPANFGCTPALSQMTVLF